MPFELVGLGETLKLISLPEPLTVLVCWLCPSTQYHKVALDAPSSTLMVKELGPFDRLLRPELNQAFATGWSFQYASLSLVAALAGTAVATTTTNAAADAPSAERYNRPVIETSPFDSEILV